MKFLVAASLLAIGAAPGQVSAEQWDGHAVLASCQALSKDRFAVSGRGGYCAGVVRAVLDLNSNVYEMVSKYRSVCAPHDLDIEMATRAVVTYGRAKPDHLQYRGALFVELALRSAYPCGSVKK